LILRRETVAEVRIQVRTNGPNRVTGPVEIVDQDGNLYTIPEGQWVSVCRCGQSKEKPFCDGAHREAGFESESKAF
jgi:CDGSH-type Zn-finger protein